MIETERLLLRPHTLSDFEDLCAMFSDPEVIRYVGGVTIPKEEVWNRLLRYIGHWSVLGYGLFAIIEKSSGRFLGDTGFADFHRYLGNEFDPFPEAAWILTSGAHGKGSSRPQARPMRGSTPGTSRPARSASSRRRTSPPTVWPRRWATKLSMRRSTRARR